ncbi:MAG TPA: selenocysteine-specific translation elongation factor [Spirochaetia bacterium]|nr:selenocysteine-specific translation elongation factor [Spirochaetia bacterium]
MRSLIIGTAGHVDHGKTALIRALTGIDTDRLKEEKERGISIELGFASLRLPSGTQAGIVDVPGHERFIRQMLAGVGGIDMVLLVVAADEGVMPQTREHMDIVGLLQITRGVVALTKVDLVDGEWLDLVREEINEYLQATTLAGAPVVPVSSVTGQGLDQLRAELDRVAGTVPEHEAHGLPRLPVDRVFSITGFGTVVTGTLVSGRLATGDAVEILPAGLTSKVRSLQVHNKKVDVAQAGQRVAVNLSGLEVEEITRGSLLASPGSLQPAHRLDVHLSLLAQAAHSLKNRARLRVHLGTAELLGRVRLLDREEFKPGEEGYIQLELESPVAAARGDRFVVRSYSPMHTIGGGTVIENMTPRYRRFRPEVLAQIATREHGTPAEVVAQHLAGLKMPAGTGDIAAATGLELAVTAEALAALVDAGQAVALEGQSLAADRFTVLVGNMTAKLAAYQADHPLREGMPREELRSRVFTAWPAKPFGAVLEEAARRGAVATTARAVHLPGFVPGAEMQDTVERAAGLVGRGGFLPPGWAEVVREMNLGEDQGAELLQFLLREGTLVKVADDVYWHQEALASARARVSEHLRDKGEITVGGLRDLLGTSRRFALPLLEYFDRERVTRRVGDVRLPGRALG